MTQAANVCPNCATPNKIGARFCNGCGQSLLAAPTSTGKKPVEIFLSYAHEDEQLQKKLITHLTILKRTGLALVWHDRDIKAGTDWARQIDSHLNTADIILLLISSDFIASDYCYSIEMDIAMRRQARGEAYVIPIILRPSNWEGTPFKKLQALPRNAKPVVSWKNQDEAWLDVVNGIRPIIEQ